MEFENADDFSQLLNNYQNAAAASKNKDDVQMKSKPHHKNAFGQTGNGSHKCMTCDYSFRSREMLFDHLSTHVSCDFDDCDFVGVAPAVSKHKREEHEQPESLTVFAMDHPAILQAWLEERRKKFPSSGNVKLKQLREQAKINHGLIAREKSYTFKDNKWGVKRHKPCIPEPDKPTSPDKPQPNDPLSFILHSGEAKPVPESTCALGLGAYDSSSDSEKDEPKVTDKNHVEPTANEPNVEFALRKFKRYAKMRAADGKKRKQKFKWNGVMKSGRRRYQPTLLQKLLSRDIVREHNTVLQCIRYVVNNNFFDKPVADSNHSENVVSSQSQSEVSGTVVSHDSDQENLIEKNTKNSNLT